MAIDKQSIDRFLTQTDKPLVKVKGRPADELRQIIEDNAGAEYIPVTDPYPYQLEGLAFAVKSRRSLMFMKMRLGKTKLALDFAEIMRKAGRWQCKGLIIAPQPVHLGVWRDEVAKHSRLKAEIVYSTDIADLRTACANDASDLIIMSWGSLQGMFTRRRPTDEKRKKVHMVDQRKLDDFAAYFDFACIDEIHNCKNHTTLRFQIAAGLTSQCDLFMGLTGTPHGRDPFDVWAQAYLCDRGRTFGRNFYFFQTALGRRIPSRFKWTGYDTVFDEAKLPVFERKLDAISLSYGWDGNLQLPEITKNIVKLEMTEQQRKLYMNYLKKLVGLRSDETRQIENAFVRLRQISSGFYPFDNEEGERQVVELDTSAKFEWIEEFIAEAPPESPIVLFHEFTITGRKLCELLTKYKRPHVWLYGGTRDRDGTLQAFRSGKVNTLVANTATGGVGIDLSRTDYMAFVESPTSPTIRQQAEARPYGKKGGHLFVDDLICSPVEERVLRLVTEGKTLLASVIYKEAKEGRFDA